MKDDPKPLKPPSRREDKISRSTKKYKSENVDKCESKRWEKRHSRNGLVLTLIGLIINGVVGFYAIKLFDETKVQTKNAADANSITKLALENQIKQDSLDSIAESIKFAMDTARYSIQNKRENEKFTLDSTSLMNQIDAFVSAKEQFKRTNGSFLEPKNFVINFIDKTRAPTAHFVIVNTGATAKILGLRTEYFSDQDSALVRKRALNFKDWGNFTTTVNGYVSTSAPKPLVAPLPFSSSVFSLCIENGNYLGCVGQIKFENIISNDVKIMTFAIRTNYVITKATDIGVPIYELLFLETIPIKKSD